jgi:hypothetical protein
LRSNSNTAPKAGTETTTCYGCPGVYKEAMDREVDKATSRTTRPAEEAEGAAGLDSEMDRRL